MVVGAEAAVETLAVVADGVGRTAYPRVRRMRAPWTRAVGLIGRKRIDPGTAYLFRRCPSVHTCFMRASIDVIMLDKGMRVLAVETMEPWRASSRKIKGARHVVEAAAGTAKSAGIVPGSLLRIVRGAEIRPF